MPVSRSRGSVNEHVEKLSATKPKKSASSVSIHSSSKTGNTSTPILATASSGPSPPNTEELHIPSKPYPKSKPCMKGMSLQIPEPALRSFTELHTEQTYLFNTLQQQNHQTTKILRKIPPLEEKLLQDHPSYIRRRLKKQIVWFKHRLDETARQEQTILMRLSQLTFEIQSRELLAQIENERRQIQLQLQLSLSSPTTQLSTPFAPNWAHAPVSSNYIPQAQSPTSPSDFLSLRSPMYMSIGQRMQAMQQILNTASPVFHPQNHQSYGSFTTGSSTPVVPKPMTPTPVSIHSFAMKPTIPSYYADYNWHSNTPIYPTSTAAALSILNTSRGPSPRQKHFDSEDEREVVSNQIYDPSSRSSSRRASMPATTCCPRPASMYNLGQALEQALRDERPKRHSLPASGSRRTSFPGLPGLSQIWKPTVDEQNEIETQNEQQKDREEQKEFEKDDDEGETRTEDEDGERKRRERQEER